MKRFYCTTCKRVVRVRKLPMLEQKAYYVSSEDGESLLLQPAPVNRPGECRRHASNNVRSVSQDRVRILHRKVRA